MGSLVFHDGGLSLGNARSGIRNHIPQPMSTAQWHRHLAGPDKGFVTGGRSPLGHQITSESSVEQEGPKNGPSLRLNTSH